MILKNLAGDDMNDNYLWDKSGEPDEEVQHLESLLSEFRYQPRPLVLPEAMPKKMIFSYTNLRYAAIAAVALLALGVGVWLSVRTATNVSEVANATPTPTKVTPAAPAPNVAPPPPASQVVRQFQTAAPKTHFARHAAQRSNKNSRDKEGEQAKEKVLYALQITSEKLNLIAKKVQADTN